MFRSLRPLTLSNLAGVPTSSGIYIIYRADNFQPIYVGRSRRNIRERLRRHMLGMGNRRVGEAVMSGVRLLFEWQEMSSVEQAEANLIRWLGPFANLRFETDPADLYG